ncbi:MAG: 50S ribosomal protein L29 [Saprospiraceae bacterium]|jgi:large subunit ribosomal protein L29
MANHKIELTGKSTEDLKAELAGMEQEYQQLKFDHAVRGLGNPMEIRDLRRNIARVNTALRSQEMETFSTEALALRTKLRARRRRK